MTTLTVSTFFNVESTLNAWLSTALAAFTRPTWLVTMPTILTNWEDIKASTPCFAFVHHPVGADNTYQGRVVGDGYKGRRQFGFMDVGCWVNRNQSPYWHAQLRTMRDMVMSAATSTATLPLMDYQSNYTTPASTIYKININEINETATIPDDDNPSFERARIIIGYSFVYRAS